MRKILCFFVSSILLAAGVFTPALAYAPGDVVCQLESLVRGNASQGAGYSETALGDLAADALRYAAGADVAIINGGELKANLQAGPCEWSDLQAVFGVERPLAVTEISAGALWEMIEYGVSFITLGEDEKTDPEASDFAGFPQVSGLTFEYDATAPAGGRVKSILAGGTTLERGDTETTFTLCATAEMLSGGYGYVPRSNLPLGLNQAEAMAGYLASGEYAATTLDAGRIRSLGTKDTPLLPRELVFVLGLIICVFCVLFGKAKRRIAPDRTLYSHVDPNWGPGFTR